MDCPVCRNVKLAIADRQGIEIDYCPQCRGVWLDRGELDKLIERSAQLEQSASTRPERQPPPPPPPQHDPRGSHGYYDHDKHYRYKKKKNLLGELFDF